MTGHREPSGECVGNCAYCDARGVARREGSMPLCTRTESETVLRRTGIAGKGTIGPANGIDPYDQAEGRCGDTLRRLEALLNEGSPVRVITRSDRVLEDLPLLARIARRGSATVLIAAATLDVELARVWEPKAIPPNERLSLLRRIREMGVSAGLMASPLVPFLMDDHTQLRSLLSAGRQAGAQYYCSDPSGWETELTLGRMRNLFAQRWPSLLDPLQRLYDGGNLPPQAYTDRIAGDIGRLAGEMGLADRSPASCSPGALLASAFARHYGG